MLKWHARTHARTHKPESCLFSTIKIQFLILRGRVLIPSLDSNGTLISAAVFLHDCRVLRLLKWPTGMLSA